MSRFVVKQLFLAGLVIGLAWTAPTPAAAAIASTDVATEEKIIGSDKALVTLIEYASLGCSHCAQFHKDTFPKIKKDYIDTGKLRMIYRDFPLGTPALAAAMIARCSGRNRYFGFVNLLFRSQAQWSRSENPLEALTKVARFGGLSADDVNACLQNQSLLDSIQSKARKAQNNHGIKSTPSFIINGTSISGAMTYDEFRKVIDRALKQVQ